MCKREQVYLALVNAVHASKLTLWLAKLFGKTQIIRQEKRVFVVRKLNNKPYLLAERRKKWMKTKLTPTQKLIG